MVGYVAEARSFATPRTLKRSLRGTTFRTEDHETNGTELQSTLYLVS